MQYNPAQWRWIEELVIKYRPPHHQRRLYAGIFLVEWHIVKFIIQHILWGTFNFQFSSFVGQMFLFLYYIAWVRRTITCLIILYRKYGNNCRTNVKPTFNSLYCSICRLEKGRAWSIFYNGRNIRSGFAWIVLWLHVFYSRKTHTRTVKKKTRNQFEG